ncbi:MAG: hypothetical protein HC837_17000 [Chloroflexaceae bacterium]|nr:hypothetical protein [Chloroflexaceae bacterium]
MTFSLDIQTLERLRTATRVALLTGTDLAIETGVPTFRQTQTAMGQL